MPTDLRAYREKLLRQEVERGNWLAVREVAILLAEPLARPTPFNLTELATAPAEWDVEQRYTQTGGFSLYHYTDMTGMLGMCRDACIRLTDLRYMSDEREYSYTLDLASQIMLGRIQRAQREGPAAVVDALRVLQHWVRAPHPIYVFCLSTLHDDLSQWRGYTPPAEGYCLGFSSRRLLSILPSGFRLAPCSYDSEHHAHALEQLIDAFLSAPRVGEAQLEAALFSFRHDLTTLATVFKDPAFRAEDEWRVISPIATDCTHPVHIRPSSRLHTLVPYVELTYTSNERYLWPICTVTVGPTPTKDLAVEAASLTMGLGADPHEQGSMVRFTRVMGSTVPYRG